MSIPPQRKNEVYLRELRLFLEEICCNLHRFHQAADAEIEPQQVRINQEYSLGIPDAFADIRVEVAGSPPYFIEVKYGYSPTRTLASLTRKYRPGALLGEASKIIVVGDANLAASWGDIEPQIRSGLPPKLNLELWDEKTLLSMLRASFGVEVDSISENEVLEMRGAVDRAKGQYAFGETWTNDELQSALIWHCGFWRVKQLRQRYGTARKILPPGMYPGVVTVMADLSGFSGYVKDTREDDIIRHCLTTFYSKARYEILNTGGMMYQFVGDEVIGLYGIPDHPEGYLESAFDCAKALVDIGNSVSHEWQRQIDGLQKARGVHIGICIGEMQVVSLRPFSRSHISGIGEVINLATRLLADAGPSQIVASNTYYQALAPGYQAAFREAAPVEAKNIGTIQAWRADLTDPAIRPPQA
jgi:class 3 adenylate cyclase